MPGSRPGRGFGFTLIEVLVALAVIAIALMAALRAAGMGMDNVSALRVRLFAGWVAENVLAEQRAREEWLPPGTYDGSAQQGGVDFTWREKVSETPNTTFRRVDIHVYASGETHAVARLTGFLTQPPGMVR
ncbi:MAG: type II secretion system minor pseudopilin GspI [Betaproteobacteria bacterium]|nr:type II secretion system minor pseudopilin GspI [Betaproteobacteria bacterium]